MKWDEKGAQLDHINPSCILTGLVTLACLHKSTKDQLVFFVIIIIIFPEWQLWKKNFVSRTDIPPEM